MHDVLESDWRLYRKRLPKWQERYIAKMIEEYMAILGSEDAPSERFWALDARMREDKRCPGVIVHQCSRSSMLREIGLMAADGVIALADLEGFSDRVINYAKSCDMREGDWSKL